MLQISNLTMQFEDKKVLANIHLHIQDKEKMAIIGSSGSGKTTFFQILSLQLKPNSGTIFYQNKNIFHYSTHEKHIYKKHIIHTLPQNLLLFENKTVYENLELFFNKKEIDSILKKHNLDDLKKRKVYTLSGGQKQKVAILRACLKSCHIYLLDEITNALDEATAKEVLDFLFSLLKDKTILIITHQLHLIKPYVQKVYLLHNGKLKEVLNEAS